MKKLIRSTMKNTILSIENRSDVEKLIHTHLVHTPDWENAQVIGLYYSFGLEWDTHTLIDIALSQGKIVTLPKTNPLDKSMRFYQFKTNNSLENVYQDIWEHIPKPELLVEADDHHLIIVPGLAFDKNGYRIGYGGGYYDRYLAQYHHRKISLAHDLQIMDEVPKNKYDQPIDMIVTNTRLIDVHNFSRFNSN